MIFLLYLMLVHQRPLRLDPVRLEWRERLEFKKAICFQELTSNGRMARGWQRRLELPCGFVPHAHSGREMAGDERASLKSHLANVIIDREHHPKLPDSARLRSR